MTRMAVHTSGLGKRYRIGVARQVSGSMAGRVKEALLRPFAHLRHVTGQASESETVWAVKDVSFDVAPGEVVGIIGRNGAGKTTLLKILSRITDPSEGTAIIAGRVGCLLAVGTGFHPELTGRENTYLNGAIMGMKKAEVKAKFDEIVAFAEVEKFIDTPVKYYSSGMYVRLAFAVAAHLDPEILIVDEVLAVGDVAFQRKCLGKMGSVAGEGRTVLLVSHNMEAILGLCSRAILIDGGRKAMDGPPREVVGAYTDSCMELACTGQSLLDTRREGSGRLRYTGFSLRDGQGRPIQYAVSGDPVELVLDFETNGEELRDVAAWIWLRDHLGRQLICLYTRATGQRFELLPAKGRMIIKVPRLPLAPGSYLVDMTAQVGSIKADKVVDAARLEVTPGDFFGSGRPLTGLGEFLVDHSWALEA